MKRRFPEGVNVTVAPLKAITPGIFTHSLQKVSTKRKVAVFIVEAFIGSENVADMGELTATPDAPLEGFVVKTVGGEVSRSGGEVPSSDGVVADFSTELPSVFPNSSLALTTKK